jgi:hypothetical protein
MVLDKVVKGHLSDMKPPLGILVESLIKCDAEGLKEVFSDRVNLLHHELFALPTFCRKDAERVRIYVSKNYVVATDFRKAYLYGLVGGRLFVNKVSGLPKSFEFLTRLHDNEKIEVCGTSDEVVWRNVLGYDYDVEGQGVVVDKPGRYRVQGDLVLNVRPVENVKQSILNALVEHQTTLLMDVIARLLLSKGLNVRLGYEHVTIPVTQPSKATADTIVDLLAEGLSELGIVNPLTVCRFSVLEVFGLKLQVPEGVALIRGDGDYRNCVMAVVPREHGVIVYLRCEAKLSSSLLDKLYEDFQEAYKPMRFEFMVANHHIVLDNARSLRVRYKPRYQPLLLGDRLVEYRYAPFDGDTWYYVTPETTATIAHGEHGETTVRFGNEYAITFHTITLDPEHVEERNTAVLKLLSKGGGGG